MFCTFNFLLYSIVPPTHTVCLQQLLSTIQKVAPNLLRISIILYCFVCRHIICYVKVLHLCFFLSFFVFGFFSFSTNHAACCYSSSHNTGPSSDNLPPTQLKTTKAVLRAATAAQCTLFQLHALQLLHQYRCH